MQVETEGLPGVKKISGMAGIGMRLKGVTQRCLIVVRVPAN